MPQPPTGTVTFLFTDIEGSTKIWEQAPEPMRAAVTRHDQILRQSIEDSRGYVFKTVGDAFCAAFATAPDALRGALAAQIALTTESWAQELPLRARMALHTGSAEERDNDYYGQPLNRVARLLAAGHGGQTLLSLATEELVRDQLPAGCALLDLGSHRLKDLARPEGVFQLLHPTLPSEFPPLRSLDNPALPNNLPQQATSFIGREKEVAEVKALLARSRLLTLTGSGGSGKTRLSLQVAADLLDQFFDGVWLIELAALADHALVPQAVADALGVREQAGKAITRTLTDELRPKTALLVLDNCEHLLTACATLVNSLLRACPHITLLASSREPLNVVGEQTYRVPSLSLPDPSQPQTAVSLSQYEAVRLFIERARLVQPAFAVTNANAPAVAEICHHLGGIPFAIELAAARVRALSVEEVNARLDDRFRLLTGGSRTALPRQQTLRALIDWSYELLSEQEKALLGRLSVFAGGWTLEAAEAVCDGEGTEGSEVLDLLTGLVDKSLVVYGEQEDGRGRYHTLETVRQYAVERLRERGESEAIGGRHAAWALALAEEAEPHLDGPEASSWLGRLETEHDNLRQSLTWFYGRVDGAEAGLRLGAALARFWGERGHHVEGLQWLVRVLERTAERESAPGIGGATAQTVSMTRARVLDGAGAFALRLQDYATARTLLEECVALRRRLGDALGAAGSLDELGRVALSQQDYVTARKLFEESLGIFRGLGHPVGIAAALYDLGRVAQEQGDPAAARALLEEGLEIFRGLGAQGLVALWLYKLGNLTLDQGDPAAARALLEESLDIFRGLGDQQGYGVFMSDSMYSLGGLALLQQDHAAARDLLEESLALRRRLGNLYGIAASLYSLGQLALEQGDYAAAQPLLEESLEFWRKTKNRHAASLVLAALGYAAMGRDDLGAARRLFDESLAIRRELGERRDTASSITDRGNLLFRQGDVVAAQALYRQSLGMMEAADTEDVAFTLLGLARVASSLGRMERAARLGGAVDALYRHFPSGLTRAEREDYDLHRARTRAALGHASFTAALGAGRAMTMEQAVAYALSDVE